MNDYFDELETGLRDAVRRRAHQPWYTRLSQFSVRHRGLAVLVTALVVATPTVAAVGAVAGWFTPGKPDFSPRAAASSGLGRVLPRAGRLLPIRVADPGGGPPWGVRLVETNRRATCIQVGRVVGGQIGSLGIDGAWDNDHRFHEIEPNDQRADICGATDAAGHGFVSTDDFGAPASVDVPLDNSGTPGRCSNPLAPHKAGEDAPCPASAMRVIYAGLLGPDAKSVSYETLSGLRGVERTSGGVGAYLFVFRETGHNCGEPYGLTLLDIRCAGGGGNGPAFGLQAPTAVTSVTYRDGRRCSDQPSPSFVAAYTKLVYRLHKLSISQARQQYPMMWRRFLVQQHLNEQNWEQAARPECRPVGWVAPKLPTLSAHAAAPIKVSLSRKAKICMPKNSPDDGDVVVSCSAHPRGGVEVSPSDDAPNGRYLVVTVSFTAPEAVRSANNSYQVDIETADHDGGYAAGTGYDIRRGQRVTLSFVGFSFKGSYNGTISFAQDTDQDGLGSDGMEKLVIGRFRIRLP